MAVPSGFRGITTDHLKCRSLGHAWDPQLTTKIQQDRRPVYRVLLVCLRCGTTRSDDVYVSDGQKLRRAYDYAEDYLVHDVKEWGGRWEFTRNARVELYGRYLKGGKRNGRKEG